MPPNRMFGQGPGFGHGRGNGNPQSFRGQNGFSGPARFAPPQARNGMNPGFGFGQGQRNQQQQPTSSGGLLSKLLGKNKNKAPSNPFAPPSAAGQATRGGAATTGAGAGGILETLKNPGALSGMLANTQKVLQAAEQVTPMIQQYGPIVKNIPSMWKIYQGLKSSGSTDSTEETPKETVENTTPVEENTAVIEEPVPEKKPRKKRTTQGNSRPKLYI
ncbi:VrrA/YqfQ family protein [Peribacillus sp. NPDC096379]|uniref:VrrA/YqfQ family protein n=1 Tax=Peribacillus sp. NPDC096379 TaxID=3364393 RepID=UPI00382E197E